MWLVRVVWRPQVGVPEKHPTVGESEAQIGTFLDLGSRRLHGAKAKPF